MNNLTRREQAILEEYELPEDKLFKAEREMVAKSQGSRKGSKTRRAQVINEDLVKKALRGSGLEKWKGCQIIDMNPGR